MAVVPRSGSGSTREQTVPSLSSTTTYNPVPFQRGIGFRSLTEADISRIVSIQLQSLRGRLAARRMSLEVTDDAMHTLAHEGFDPAFGARPLKRVIQREISDRAATLILEGGVGEGDAIVVDSRDGQITVERAALATV